MEPLKRDATPQIRFGHPSSARYSMRIGSGNLRAGHINYLLPTCRGDGKKRSLAALYGLTNSNREAGTGNTRLRGAQTPIKAGGVTSAALDDMEMINFVRERTSILFGMHPIASAELEGLATSGQAHSEP